MPTPASGVDLEQIKGGLTRENLGRVIQEAWRLCALEMPSPPPSWLKTYEEVSPGMREIDNFIGEQVAAFILSELVAQSMDPIEALQVIGRI